MEAIRGGGHGRMTSPFPWRRSRVRAEVGERGKREEERGDVAADRCGWVVSGTGAGMR
jgi:hypothetical protein